MKWMEMLVDSLNYIEEHIYDEFTAQDISDKLGVSTFYFQKSFTILCGYSIGEYIRNRKLALAGIDVISTQEKIIDIAFKYGYDTPESFTKAFTRFHGCAPYEARNHGATIKSFPPIKIKISLEGGTIMDYKIVEKQEMKIIGYKRSFGYGTSKKEIPLFWDEYFGTKRAFYLCGIYAFCEDTGKTPGFFDYYIADNYVEGMKVEDGYEVITLPAQTWAVFPCVGPMPNALQDVNKKIFEEWLPNNDRYSLANNYNIEFYSDLNAYPEKNQSPNYYSEIWIPIKTK